MVVMQTEKMNELALPTVRICAEEHRKTTEFSVLMLNLHRICICVTESPGGIFKNEKVGNLEQRNNSVNRREKSI